MKEHDAYGNWLKEAERLELGLLFFLFRVHVERFSVLVFLGQQFGDAFVNEASTKDRIGSTIQLSVEYCC